MFDSPFTSYAYAYPHKSAYRSIVPAIPLEQAWHDQAMDSLFLYLHIPFCEFRCGFCNLFTLSQPGDDWPAQYIAALRRQAETVRDRVPNARFVQLAVGGGTPTFLNINELAELLSIMGDTMDCRGASMPAGIEASPATVDSDKLKLLRDFGFDRISIGVQSFVPQDLKSIGRPQRDGEVDSAIDQIRKFDFPTLNLDLIYGADGQSAATWMQSVRRAVDYRPEEIYLYPLYVRRATGLAKIGGLDMDPSERREWDQQRLELYRMARDYLLEQGYRQVSMRMFRASSTVESKVPDYCCQSDGMIGLGCGARSYTDRLHYSYEYAVASSDIQRILSDYMQLDPSEYAQIRYGYALDREDQQRRFLVLSLLQCQGFASSDYREHFGSELMTDFPALQRLVEFGHLELSADNVRLTQSGIELSDAIGPWLNSARVEQLIHH